MSWHYVGLGMLLVKAERTDAGIEVLKDGLKRMPDSVVLLTNLANFYMKAGRFAEASESSRAALKLDPRNFDALVVAGWSEDMRCRLGEGGRFLPQGPGRRAGEQDGPDEICLCRGGHGAKRGGGPYG